MQKHGSQETDTAYALHAVKPDAFFDRLIKALEYLSQEAKSAGQGDVSVVLNETIVKSLEIYVEHKRTHLENSLRERSSIAELRYD
jgi:hypothetical protein